MLLRRQWSFLYLFHHSAFHSETWPQPNFHSISHMHKVLKWYSAERSATQERSIPAGMDCSDIFILQKKRMAKSPEQERREESSFTLKCGTQRHTLPFWDTHTWLNIKSEPTDIKPWSFSRGKTFTKSSLLKHTDKYYISNCCKLICCFKIKLLHMTIDIKTKL